MKKANEILELRRKMVKDFENERRNIDGQWNLIESIVDNVEITKDTKFISLGNVGKLYDENSKKIVELGYFIDENKQGTNLYFSKEDYNKDSFGKDLCRLSNKKSLKDDKSLYKAPFKVEGMEEDELNQMLRTFMGWDE